MDKRRDSSGGGLVEQMKNGEGTRVKGRLVGKCLVSGSKDWKVIVRLQDWLLHEGDVYGNVNKVPNKKIRKNNTRKQSQRAALPTTRLRCSRADRRGGPHSTRATSLRLVFSQRRRAGDGDGQSLALVRRA